MHSNCNFKVKLTQGSGNIDAKFQFNRLSSFCVIDEQPDTTQTSIFIFIVPHQSTSSARLGNKVIECYYKFRKL